MNNKILIASGRNSADLAAKIALELGYQIAEIKWKKFSDGEYKPKFLQNIRGADIYFINSTNMPIDNLYEVLLLADSAKRAGAPKMVHVCPYFGGQRQERKDESRVPITAKLNADLLDAVGIRKMIMLDLHADAIQGFFNFTVDHLHASYFFVPDIISKNIQDLIFAAPDTGGLKRVKKYAKHFGVKFAICDKDRSDEPNAIEEMYLIGNVDGKDVVLIDDIADTCGTIERCVKLLWENKARSITIYITHPVLSGNAYDIIKSMTDIDFVTTNTIPINEKFLELKNFRVIGIEKMFAEAIRRDVNDESISSLFVF